MIHGGCLCGGVRFEITRVVGPFELCHCTRCRKASGSAFVPWLWARREDFRLVQGGELIQSYEAPLRDKPPSYDTSLWRRSRRGSRLRMSCLNWIEPASTLFEIAGRRKARPKPYLELSTPWD